MIANIETLRTQLHGNFPEREEVIDGALVAILTEQNCLLVGPPGTAKSMLISTLCNAIEGANYFQWLLTKFTTPEELFGPYSLPDLEQGVYRRITAGKLPEAHIAFVDEIFKASSAILNALLTLINERLFYNDSQVVHCPLISLFGASNELPTDREELSALYDRFTLRFKVDYVQEVRNLVHIIKNDPVITAKITLDELRQAQMEVEQVAVSDDILHLIMQVKMDLANKGIVPSDRKWKMAVKALKGYAYLEGKTEVEEGDVVNLQHMLWDVPDQKAEIVKTIYQIVNPDDFRATDLYDTATDIYTKAIGADSDEEVVEALTKLKNVQKELSNLKESKTVKEVKVKVSEMQKELMKQKFDIDL